MVAVSFWVGPMYRLQERSGEDGGGDISKHQSKHPSRHHAGACLFWPFPFPM